MTPRPAQGYAAPVRDSDPRLMLNTPDIEVWPGGLLRARRNADARLLASARHVLRRKRDGRYLAVIASGGLRPMVAALAREPGLAAALRATGAPDRGAARGATLPLDRLQQQLARLGLDDGYAARTGLTLVAEPTRLSFAGRDQFGRVLWLDAGAGRAWQRMRADARRDGVRLDAISGYRSHEHQLGIFARKLARGLRVEQILAVNAAPGYSEHHGGCALDLGTPGEPPAEESFEHTPAFDWLMRRAGDYGFALSYPRGNPHGIVYEPWHWCWRASCA
jgi:D-alanyl-D-alanine carboxypeptidase